MQKYTDAEVLIANKRLGKTALHDPVIISRLFKRITNKTLKNIRPDKRLVITRPFRPASEIHTGNIVNRILALDENGAKSVLKQTLKDFAHRHKDIQSILMRNYQKISGYIKDPAALSDERKLLLGACFTMEYSIESAALFNPSIVIYPKQNNLKRGQTRVIFSFRATGEGHISSIVFRSALIDKDNSIFLEPVSPFLGAPEIVLNATYDRELFKAKLKEMGQFSEAANAIYQLLPSSFTLEEMGQAITSVRNKNIFSDMDDSIIHIKWLAESNYEVFFPHGQLISERVIFPLSQNESNGVEDARFVRFVDDDDNVTYYATYTAYNGREILPQLIETKDFHHFKISTLNGPMARNKGMALFPRKINGQYAMITRTDGENLYLSYSNNIHFWFEGVKIEAPENPWELVQIGNCGSPLETKKGWILLTHGVGPMRKYCIGVVLLDLKDPSKIIGRLKEPLLMPREEEREGYVPNVVYSCGSIILNNELIIPYAISDSDSHVASIPVDELLEKLLRQV
ncbi:MAG: putative glycosylase [Candidatus Saganbacteria bacterium]|uniref:Putative glycosylase n=1 Tax=Candidatus Saganbacteria bacterium TaxID=2575572 RepID=A0A833P0G3_UNCSA|nr:MAG: putative glycosylase [Candidatus Saganbacteria bacterium]